MKADNSDVLLPEEEQLYREFELYLDAMSDRTSRAMIARIDEFVQKLQPLIAPLAALPNETRSTLDEAITRLEQIARTNAAEVQQRLDTSLQQLDEISQNNSAQMQQRLDTSLRQLDEFERRADRRTHELLDRINSLIDKTEASIDRRLVTLRNLLFAIGTLVFVSLILQTLLLVWTMRR